MASERDPDRRRRTGDPLDALRRPRGRGLPPARGDRREALARVGEEVPDLVVLDIWLPEMDGIEVLAELKPSGPSCPWS